MSMVHSLRYYCTYSCLAVGKCKSVSVHRYAHSHLHRRIKYKQHVGNAVSMVLTERCFLLLIYWLEPMWTRLSLFPSLQPNLAVVQTAVVCILVEDFGHDGGQFELYQHSPYISPNLLVIRKHLGWICAVVLGYTWSSHMKRKEFQWSISTHTPVSMR